jgi:hypothetical protein
MFFLQQNQRTRGQNRFCQEAGVGVGGDGGGSNNVYTLSKSKNKKIKERKNLKIFKN